MPHARSGPLSGCLTVHSHSTQRAAEFEITVEGKTAFTLSDTTSMRQLSRDRNSWYCRRSGSTINIGRLHVVHGHKLPPLNGPRGLAKAYHEIGDVVTISSRALGSLVNTVRPLDKVSMEVWRGRPHAKSCRAQSLVAIAGSLSVLSSTMRVRLFETAFLLLTPRRSKP